MTSNDKDDWSSNLGCALCIIVLILCITAYNIAKLFLGTAQ